MQLTTVRMHISDSKYVPNIVAHDISIRDPPAGPFRHYNRSWSLGPPLNGEGVQVYTAATDSGLYSKCQPFIFRSSYSSGFPAWKCLPSVYCLPTADVQPPMNVVTVETPGLWLA